jgi:hypothetical protein
VTDAGLADALERLWAVNRPNILARAAAVLAALEDAAAERPFDREVAAREAHTLAGALGTYGRPGSALFAEVERILAGEAAGGEPEADPRSCAERVRRAITQI